MLDLENIIVIGTSHENLSLLERENFMRTRPKYIIEKLYSEKKINAYINLSTCLRTEFYIELNSNINISNYLNEKEIKDLGYININLFTNTLSLIPPKVRIINILLKLLEKLAAEYNLIIEIIHIEKIDHISKIFLEEFKRRDFIVIKE